MTSPAEALNDAQLIDRVRMDDAEAFGELRRRHQSDATRTARITAHNPDEADQVVGAAFEHLHTALTADAGPRTAVSPYLRTMIRRGSLDAHRTPGDEHEAVDPAAVDDLPYTTDPLTAVEDRNIIREAYESLPERWQRVLWFTEIESRTPAALVPDLGSAASAVAAMAYRAREGLRRAYLAVHMSVAVSAECQPVVEALPAYVREALSPEDDVTVAIHLDTCVDCRNRRYELLLLVSNLRSVLAPALLGYPAGTPAATRPVAGLGGAAAAGVAVAAGRVARTSALAAMAAVGRWPRRSIKVATTATACVLAAAALAWAASSTFAPTTPADAAGSDREPLTVTFEHTDEPDQDDTTTMTDPWDGIPIDTEQDPAQTDSSDEPDEPVEPETASAAEAPAASTADDPTRPADAGNNTSGAEPADSSTTEPAGDGAVAGAGDDDSAGFDAGDGGNQDPPDGSDSDPDQQPAPPAGNDDGDDSEEGEPADPDENPDEDEEQDESGLLERIVCGLFQC